MNATKTRKVEPARRNKTRLQRIPPQPRTPLGRYLKASYGDSYRYLLELMTGKRAQRPSVARWEMVYASLPEELRAECVRPEIG